MHNVSKRAFEFCSFLAAKSDIIILLLEIAGSYQQKVIFKFLKPAAFTPQLATFTHLLKAAIFQNLAEN